MVELGLLEDHQGDDEPALRCRAPPEGRGEPGGTPGGMGGPGGPREGPPGGDPGGVSSQGADVAGLPGGEGRCSASRLRTPTTDSPGPCATPSPTGATAGQTRHRHSPNPHTSGNAGDSPDGAHWRVGGGQCRGRPPRRSRAPHSTPPPRYSATERRAPPPVGGGAGATSARGGRLPRSPLTPDR